ncbi:hypothetical protein AB0T83_03565 [Fluviibacterium sp. DFM31]|uniref:Uncharacterized protein n=1 Tax=Meridianimarinicoccus marinus TaxID=3231483 RepID=A0ABV3L486_9RHOB
MFRFPTRTALCLLLTTTPALADDVTDTLDAARAAYDDGNITAAIEELAYAQSLLQAMRTDGLAAFLPEASEGWTREVSTEMSGALAFTGGGTGAEATYSNGDQSFSITLLADSPMMMAMAPMLANPMLATASGGKLHRMGSVKVLETDGQLMTLVANRFLIQAEGASTDVMMPMLESMDLDGLAGFNP